jgi:hypothetical protein
MVLSVDKRDWVAGMDTSEEESAPSLAELLELKNDYITYFRPFHEKCAIVDQYTTEQNAVAVPEGFEPIHSAKARSIISTATAHVDINNLDITVPLASSRAKARAEKLTKFYQGVWLQIDPAIKRTQVKHAFAYGIAWRKDMWESDKWPDGPIFEDFEDAEAYKDALEDFYERRDISFPITTSNVNPKRLLWDDSRLGPKWVIEFYDRRDAKSLRKRYPEWSGDTKSGGVINWMEYWDDKWAVYIANNEIVFAEQHGYGYMPYTAALPSFGLDYDDGPPHERYQGILDGSFSTLDEIDRTVSAHTAILRAFAWPTIDFIGPPHLVETARQNYELFGGLNSIPAGVEVRVSPRPQPPPELIQHLSLLETQLEEQTFPNIIRGVRPRGVSSGFQVSVLAGMGRLVFQPVADAMGRSAAQSNMHFAKLVENKVHGKLTVHARSEVHNFDQSIGADDIRGYYENRVVFKAEAPEEREREALLAKTLKEAGIISQYEAMRRSGVINPLEMQVDIQAEALIQSPEFQMAMNQIAAERVGLLEQLAQATEAGPGGGGEIGGINPGQFLAGQSQLQRPGEASIQRNRVASQQEGAAFPGNLGGLDVLGGLLGSAGGGSIRQPSGGRAG